VEHGNNENGSVDKIWGSGILPGHLSLAFRPDGNLVAFGLQEVDLLLGFAKLINRRRSHFLGIRDQSLSQALSSFLIEKLGV